MNKILESNEIKTQFKNENFDFQNCTFNSISSNTTAPSGKTAIDFGELYKKMFGENNKTIKLKFTNCIFNIDVLFNTKPNNSEQNIFWFNFNEESFNNCTFNREVYFEHCLFSRKDETEIENHTPIFVNVIFNDLLYINNNIFNKGEIFSKECAFQSDIVLFRSIFNDSMGLYGLTFKGNFFIEGCTFKNEVYFTNLIFEKNLNITSIYRGDFTIFENLTIFSFTVRGILTLQDVSFDIVNVSEVITFNNYINVNRVDFHSFGIFRNMILGNNVSFIDCDLTNCSFLYSDFENAIFSSCKFNFKTLVDEKFLFNDMTTDFKEKTHWLRLSNMRSVGDFSIEDLLKVLKQFEIYFDKFKDYENAGEFHKKAFEVQRKKIEIAPYIILKSLYKYDSKNYFKNIKSRRQKIYNRLKYRFLRKMNIVVNYSLKFKKWFNLKYFFIRSYKLFSDYGESYSKPLVIYFVFIFIFSILYFFVGLDYVNNDLTIYHINWLKHADNYIWYNDYMCSLIYSLNSSFPIKKDLLYIRPGNIFTNSLSNIQILLQTITLAIFVLALRRKFKR